MSDEPRELYAWVGEDELGSGDVGLKQANVPAGCIPLVVIGSDQHKLKRAELIAQLQRQADQYGKPIRLVRYEFAQEVLTIQPKVRR